MKERPILMSQPMAQAILKGWKTQTRRIVKPQPKIIHSIHSDGSLETERIFRKGDQRIHCPYGKTGDRLWVRETHYVYGYWTKTGTGVTKSGKPRWKFIPRRYLNQARCVKFPGDKLDAWQQVTKDKSGVGMFKRPSIFMLRGDSRILLEIVSVRVERLNDISEEDARAEGCVKNVATCGMMLKPRSINYIDARNEFSALWESINGEESWKQNPWVWVIEFKRVKS